MGGAAGPVRSTDSRYLSNFLAVFVFWSICEICSIVQSRPGHTKVSFTRGLSSRPRHRVIAQRQQFSRSWAGAVWVWKVSPRGLFLSRVLAAGWKDGQAVLCGGGGHMSGPGLGGPEPHCGTGSFTRFPQTVLACPTTHCPFQETGPGHGGHFLFTERAGPVPGFLHGWPHAQVQNCRPWGYARGPSDGRDAPGVPDDARTVQKDCSDIPPGARGLGLREGPTTAGLQGEENPD